MLHQRGQNGPSWDGRRNLKKKKTPSLPVSGIRRRFLLPAPAALISGGRCSFSSFSAKNYTFSPFDSCLWLSVSVSLRAFLIVWVGFSSIYISGCVRYRHLMLNVVSLLPHCKKDNKVESKETKGATLNELVELRNCSSCLFFEVGWSFFPFPE